MKIASIAFFAALAMTSPSWADGKIYVQLPDLTKYEGEAAEQYLAQIVLANVVSSNCKGFEVTEEEWSLLTDAADLLAYGQLKLTANDYDNLFYDPAFKALDDASTCQTSGPEVKALLDELVAQGGSRQALPDQEAAYQEWRTLMDRLQSEANASHMDAPPPRKTKTK